MKNPREMSKLEKNTRRHRDLFWPSTSDQIKQRVSPKGISNAKKSEPLSTEGIAPCSNHPSPSDEKRRERLKELIGHSSSLGKNTCYTFDEAIEKVAKKLDEAEKSPIFSRELEYRPPLALFFNLFLSKLIFQGKVDCGIINSENMISPLRDMKICYDSFYKKMCNLANIPLEAISIFHERNNENENIEDVFKEFLQYLSINKKRGHGIIYSLAGNTKPDNLGYPMTPDLGEMQ